MSVHSGACDGDYDTAIHDNDDSKDVVVVVTQSRGISHYNVEASLKGTCVGLNMCLILK